MSGRHFERRSKFPETCLSLVFGWLREVDITTKADCVHDCDVLVLGGGLAGCWAALRAREFTDKVILVEKAKIGKSGASSFCAGVMLAPIMGDDLDIWMEEIVRRGECLNDQDWLKLVLTEQINRLQDLVRWGLPVERDGRGNLLRMLGRGHVKTRLVPFPGAKLMEIFRQQVLERKIKLMERIMALDLLTSDGFCPTEGRVVGAVGIGTRTGDFHIFRSRSIVIATSSLAGRGTMFTDNLSGDGVAMAFRSGAELHGMEFAGPRTGWVFDRRYKVSGLNLFQNAGAFFVNSLGQKIMDTYDPELKDRARTVELSQAFAKEAIEGRGPIYIDMTHVAQEKWDQFKRILPGTMKIFETLKPWQSKVVFDVGASGFWSNCSGIYSNLSCETNLPGLYVAGQAGGFLAHGTYSVGGLNLAISNVSGFRAGEFAARYSLLCAQPRIRSSQVKELRSLAFSPLESREVLNSDEIDRQLKEILHPAAHSLFRHEKRMRKMVDEIVAVRRLASKAMARDPHELVRVHEIWNHALTAELVFRASLERKESRGYNLREDYPYRDDANWLKRVILKRQSQETLGIRFETVPVYRYPVKPEGLERIPPRVVPPRYEPGN